MIFFNDFDLSFILERRNHISELLNCLDYLGFFVLYINEPRYSRLRDYTAVAYSWGPQGVHLETY